MIEHINLNDGTRDYFREADCPKKTLSRIIEALSGPRGGFDDGYCVSGGYLRFDRTDYLFGLFTPDRNVFERWIGFELTHEGKQILAAALIHAPEQFPIARERLYGAWLHGMPHRPPKLQAYPEAEHFPSLLSVSFTDFQDANDGLYQTARDHLPCIAFAIIRLLQNI